MFRFYSTCGNLICIVSMEAKELASTSILGKLIGIRVLSTMLLSFCRDVLFIVWKRKNLLIVPCWVLEAKQFAAVFFSRLYCDFGC